MTDQLIALASQFGAPGLLIGFMIWDRTQRSAEDKAREAARLAVDKDRIAIDVDMAKALTQLSERLNHVR